VTDFFNTLLAADVCGPGVLELRRESAADCREFSSEARKKVV
jgi:hypothetical protein